jgi:hypothetical protein
MAGVSTCLQCSKVSPLGDKGAGPALLPAWAIDSTSFMLEDGWSGMKLNPVYHIASSNTPPVAVQCRSLNARVPPPQADLSEALEIAHEVVGRQQLGEEVKRVDATGWEEAVRASYVPLKVAEGVWIVPEWSTPLEPSALNIILQPGVAFGTGARAPDDALPVVPSAPLPPLMHTQPAHSVPWYRLVLPAHLLPPVRQAPPPPRGCAESRRDHASSPGEVP